MELQVEIDKKKKLREIFNSLSTDELERFFKEVYYYGEIKTFQLKRDVGVIKVISDEGGYHITHYSKNDTSTKIGTWRYVDLWLIKDYHFKKVRKELTRFRN